MRIKKRRVAIPDSNLLEKTSEIKTLTNLVIELQENIVLLQRGQQTLQQENAQLLKKLVTGKENNRKQEAYSSSTISDEANIANDAKKDNNSSDRYNNSYNNSSFQTDCSDSDVLYMYYRDQKYYVTEQYERELRMKTDRYEEDLRRKNSLLQESNAKLFQTLYLNQQRI